MRQSNYLSLLLLMCMSLFFGCSSDGDVAKGPGSETTNGIVAYVDGTPAPYAGVALRRVEFASTADSPENAVINPDKYASEDGAFVVDVCDTCEYRLTVVHNGFAFSGVFDGNEIDRLDSVSLTATASISGVVNVPDGCEFVWVGVYGMDVLAKSDSMGRFMLPSVPSNDSLDVYFMRSDDRQIYDRVSVKYSPYENGVVVRKSEPDDDVDSVGLMANFVVRTEGVSAAYAMASILSPDYVSDSATPVNMPILAKYYSDEFGNFTFALPDSGTFRFTVVQSGFAYSKELSVEEIAKIDTLELQGTATLSGKVTLKSGEGFAWVGVKGLDILVKTDSSGNYVLPSLPSDDSLEIYFKTENFESLYATESVLLSPFAAEFDSPSMLLQDFEGSVKDWYYSVDTVGSSVSPANVKDGIVYDSTRKSKVFKGEYSLVDNSFAWALVGANLKDEAWNLSSLDSIVFYAKGKGKIRVAIENWDVASEDSGTALKAASEWLSMDESALTRFVIKPSDLCRTSQDKLDCDASWGKARVNARQLHFFPNGGTEFYIDDIWLYGALF